MANPGGGRFDDDPTRITGKPSGVGDKTTRIIGGSGGGGGQDDATRIITDTATGGTVIGVAGLQQGVRVGPGFPGGLGPVPDGQTQYLPPQPEQGDLAAEIAQRAVDITAG